MYAIKKNPIVKKAIRAYYIHKLKRLDRFVFKKGPGTPGYKRPMLFKFLNFIRFKLHINTYPIDRFLYRRSLRKVHMCIALRRALYPESFQ